MVKSYKLKIYPNKTKALEINKLLAFWRDQVNHNVSVFWSLDDVVGLYPPKDYIGEGTINRESSIKAWGVVKEDKKLKKLERPFLDIFEIDLNENMCHIIEDFKTKEFDIWFNVICLNKYARLKLPAKRTELFNEALKLGALSKSFKLISQNSDYYMICFVNILEKQPSLDNSLVGIDVGLNNAITTSDGKLLGKEIKALRIKTKHRKYKTKITPCKQRINYYAKELPKCYPGTNFVMEDLLFKGKKGRTKEFRRRNNTWAYNHLSKRLIELGKLEGFELIKVDPAYSSQTCPVCGFTDSGNRLGSLFRCGRCGHEGHADVVAAINLVGRVPAKIKEV